MNERDTIITIAIIVFVGAFIGMIYFLNTSDWKDEEKVDWDKIRSDWDYQQSTKKLVNETGIPEQYTCEQINIMIKTEVYPEYRANYDCKTVSRDTYEWCSSWMNSNTKDSFVTYYLTECLEQKDFVIQEVQDNG